LGIVSLLTAIFGPVLCADLLSPVALITGFTLRKLAAAKPFDYAWSENASVGLILGLTVTLLFFAFISMAGTLLTS